MTIRVINYIILLSFEQVYEFSFYIMYVNKHINFSFMFLANYNCIAIRKKQSIYCLAQYHEKWGTLKSDFVINDR
jgi:hypothetical protein